MVKDLFLKLLLFLVPVILIFTVYRAALGIGPIYFKSVLLLLEDSFSDSQNGIMDLSTSLNDLLDIIFADSEYKSNPMYEEMLSSSNPFEVISGYIGSFIDKNRQKIVPLLVGILELIGLIVRFAFLLIKDLFLLVDVLTSFVIGNSPYQVAPYYPVG